MTRIKINELRAKGVRKDYSVTFRKGLNIISGEISTGKTSILELIDYCFGDTDHPKYPELAKNTTTALLEIEIGEETFTIERQLFSTRKMTNIHFCGISELKSDHKLVEVHSKQKKGEESISSFILSKIGLKGVRLKEAPTQKVSGIDIMSFRDVMWLCYLERTRVAGANLLFEKTHMKAIKLRQVAEVIFDLHSDRLTILSGELKIIQEENQEKQRTEKTLQRFVDSQGMLTLEELSEKKEKLIQESLAKKKALAQIDAKLSGSSEVAKGLRKEVLDFRAKLQEIRTDKRSNEKLLQRLTPLRAQYHEDILKLNFLTRARKLINPLSIVCCPVCLSDLDASAEGDELCPLCRKKIKLVDSDMPTDVSKEIRIINRKLNELNTYIGEVEERTAQNGKMDIEISEKLKLASQKMDETLKSFVSPYIAERDELVSAMSGNENEVKHIDELIKVRMDIQEITESIIKLQVRQNEILANMEEERKKSIQRKELISSLSSTFYNQLEMVRFPKLSKAYIDEKMVPYIRELRYDKLSSEGAISLSSICWLTSIFAEAIQRSFQHPGFLILDGVQSGIGIGVSVDKEFQDEKIVEGLYRLLKEMSELDDNCQLIVVDNHPPNYMDDDVVVYYSRDPSKPPYGFIDDAIS